MAFRPTIAVIADNEIADIGYYRNWQMEDLFIEALGIAVTYSDLKTVEGFRNRAFGTQNIGYVIEPEVLENTQENLEWMMECSEFPIIVDLTRRAIYCGYGCLTDVRYDGIPDMVDSLWKFGRGEDFYWDILSKYKISFDKIDLDNVRDLFMEDSELRDHLSKDTKEVMERTFKERMSGPDDETRVHNYRS